LELGCGTGRVLLYLTAKGYTVFGLDNDARMLTYLREQIRDIDIIDSQLIQADMTSFRLSKEFALVLLPCNTYSTLITDQRINTLGCVYRHLLPGGLFAFSVLNPSLWVDIPMEGFTEVEEIISHPSSSNPVQVSSAWHREKVEVRFLWHYDHLLPDGTQERHTVTTLHYMTPLETIQEELEVSGFNIEGIYGGFDRSAYTAQSPYLILIAEK
jgi:SAM-dependent methyltransferase